MTSESLAPDQGPQKPLRSVVVAVDLEKTTDRTLASAARLAAQHGAKLVVLHVVEWLESWWSPMKLSNRYLDPIREQGLERVGDAVGRLRELPPEVDSKVEFGSAWEVILRTAESESTDLIVVGTRGRHGAEDLLLGSTAERVLTRASAPVLAVPPEGPLLSESPSRVLLPTDLSLDFELPLQAALRLTETTPALFLLHAVDLPHRYGPLAGPMKESARGAVETLREHVEEAADELRAAGLDVTSIVEIGHPAETILKAVEQHSIDLTALCSRGGVPRRPLHFGSTAQRVVRQALSPVLCVTPTE